MNLVEAIELDRMGIFPAPDESLPDFLTRGQMVLTEASKPSLRDAQARVHQRLSIFGDQTAASKALGYIKKRFGCDLSWVRIYSANLGNPLIEAAALGVCLGAREYFRDNQLTAVEPPFIIVNRYASEGGTTRTLIHEMTHLPRGLAFNTSIVYSQTLNFEERLARSHSWRQLLEPEGGLHLIFSPVNYQYLQAERKLRQAFRDRGGYVLMRMSYDEIKDLLIDRGLNPRLIVATEAARGRLKYQVMQEVLSSSTR